jgi:aminoglycoside phosphotransferase (APT) family kinase protein
LTLFGMNVYDHMPRRRHLVAFLSRHTSLVIPQALHIDLSQKVFQRPFVVYEKLPGKSPVSPFGSPVIARELGEHLGRVHAANFRFWGSYPPPPEFALHDWPPRLASSLEKLAPRAFSDQPAVIEALPGFVAQARRLSPPSSASLILPDLRPNQFLVRDGHLFALVDIESHVLGPRELDFVALEYSLSQDDLEAFTDGYTHHLALPDLGAVRQLYRYFYWVIKAIGSDNYKQWMEHLTLF